MWGIEVDLTKFHQVHIVQFSWTMRDSRDVGLWALGYPIPYSGKGYIRDIMGDSGWGKVRTWALSYPSPIPNLTPIKGT